MPPWPRFQNAHVNQGRSFAAPAPGFFHAQVHDEYGQDIGMKLVNADGKAVRRGTTAAYFASVGDLVTEKGSITIVVSGSLGSRFSLRIFFVPWKDYQSQRKP